MSCELCWVLNYASGAWGYFRDLLNSNFSTALFGAAAGAWSAQYIVEKQKNRETLLSEIRNTNAALMLAFDFCNLFLTIKEQHVKELKYKYDNDRTKIELEKKKEKENRSIFTIHIDMQTLTIPFFPLIQFEDNIFRKISLNGRPLILSILLIRVFTSLSDFIVNRNKLIDEYRQNEDQSKLIHVYFGFPDKDGGSDNRFKSTIDGISEYTDDCIYFSLLLCEDLREHGLKLQKKFGKNSPNINKPDFEIAKLKGLLPNPSKYEDWAKGFKKQDENQKIKGLFDVLLAILKGISGSKRNS